MLLLCALGLLYEACDVVHVLTCSCGWTQQSVSGHPNDGNALAVVKMSYHRARLASALLVNMDGPNNRMSHEA